MSSISSKDYSQMLDQLSNAFDSLTEAKENPKTREEKLRDAHTILETVGKQLKSSAENVKGQGKIQDVMEKYHHVLRKFDEVNSYGASGEKIVRESGPAKLKKGVEALKLAFNQKLRIVYGKASLEGEAITEAMGLTEKVEGKLESFKKAYNRLQDDLMSGKNVDPGLVKDMRADLETLRDELKKFGVPDQKIIGGKPSEEAKEEVGEDGWDKNIGPGIPKADSGSDSSKRSSASGNAPLVEIAPDTGFARLARRDVGGIGAGALRRKLVLDLAKLVALEGRLDSLEKAATHQITDEPHYEIKTDVNAITGAKTNRIEGIEDKSIADIEKTFIQLRSLDRNDLPPERLARLELAQGLFQKEFTARANAILGNTTGKFKAGEAINQRYTEAAAAAYFTFQEGDSTQAIRFGRLLAHMMLEGKSLDLLRDRINSPSGKIPNETSFTQGYLSLLNERLKGTKNGSLEREVLIRKTIDSYASATGSEKEAIGNFLEGLKKDGALPAKVSPAVFLMRRESALLSPEGSFKEKASFALGEILKFGIKELTDLDPMVRTKLGQALVKAAREEFPTLEKTEDFRKFQTKLDDFEKQGGDDLLGPKEFSSLVDAFKQGLGVHLREQLSDEAGTAKRGEVVQQAIAFSKYLPSLGVPIPSTLLKEMEEFVTNLNKDPILLSNARAQLSALKTLFGGSEGLTAIESKLTEKQMVAQQERMAAYKWVGVDIMRTNLTRSNANPSEVINSAKQAINAATKKGDSDALYTIESDLEKLRVDPQLAKHRERIEGVLTELQKGIKADQTLSFNRMQRLIEEKLPDVPPSGKKPWVREDLRTLLSVVQGGKPGDRLESKAREEIAAALNAGKKLHKDSFAVNALKEFISAAAKAEPPRDQVVARAYNLLSAVTTPIDGGRLLSSYKIDLVKSWEFRDPENIEGFKPTPEQKVMLDKWNPDLSKRVAFTPIEHLHAKYGVLDRISAEAGSNEELKKVTDLLYKEIANYERFERVVNTINEKGIKHPLADILVKGLEENRAKHLQRMERLLGNKEMTAEDLLGNFQKFIEEGGFRDSYQFITGIGMQIAPFLPEFNKEFGKVELDGVTSEWGSVGSSLRDQMNDLANHYGLLTNTIKELAWIHIERNEVDKKEVKANLGSTVGPDRDKRKNEELRRILNRDENSDSVIGNYAQVVKMIDETIEKVRAPSEVGKK